MALTVPDGDDLLLHMRRRDKFDSVETEWADDSLQRATDLMEIATDLHEDPTDDLALRVMNTGILAMAHAIFASSLDKTIVYGPFQSERIGSYSYSKAATAVQTKTATGVEEFDFAVNYLRGLDDSVDPMNHVTSEEVFKQPLNAYEQDQGLDPISRDVALLPDAWNLGA